LDEQGRLYLDKVRSSAALLSEMVDGLRELAHAGTRVECVAGVDPLPVLRLVCETLNDVADENGVEILLPERVPDVVCDRARLYQIFQNLVSNAVRYADREKPERWVRVEADELEGNVAIQVADNGAGMDEVELREIFQPFRRGAQAGEGAGMGLGLAITQRIVQASSGSIEVVSTPGQGSCFTVCLPRYSIAEDAATPPDPNEPQ
jgi:signal transduction histidine kinase